MSKLTEFYKDLPEEKRVFAKKLIDQLTWMEKTLRKLKKTVDENGATFTATNGNGFEIVQEHPAQKSYNTMIKNYNATLKQLIELLPEEKGTEEDELMKYITGGA